MIPMRGSPGLPSARALLTAAGTATALCCAIALAAPRSALADGVLHSWFFDLLYYTGLTASVALLAVRARRPGPGRLSWALLTLGALSWLVGDLVWLFLVSGLDPAPAASVADVGYLLMFPFTYAGVMTLVRLHTGRLPVATWLDGIVAGLGFGALTGAFLNSGHVTARAPSSCPGRVRRTRSGT